MNQKAVKMIVPRKKLFGFFQLPQSSTEISSEKKMISPPMVGVPSLLARRHVAEIAGAVAEIELVDDVDHPPAQQDADARTR